MLTRPQTARLAGKQSSALPAIGPALLPAQGPLSTSSATAGRTSAVLPYHFLTGLTNGRARSVDVLSDRTSVPRPSQSKFKPIKFTCKQRDALLTDLLQCAASAYALGNCAIAPKLLGSPTDFPAAMLQGGVWAAATLRLTAYGFSVLKPSTGEISYRLDYVQLAAPGITLLSAAPAGASGALPPAPPGAFAVFAKCASAPQLFACAHRDSLVTGMRAAAQDRLGLGLLIDAKASLGVDALLEAVAAAERSHAAHPSEAPVGQWQVGIRARYATVVAMADGQLLA